MYNLTDKSQVSFYASTAWNHGLLMDLNVRCGRKLSWAKWNCVGRRSKTAPDRYDWCSLFIRPSDEASSAPIHQSTIRPATHRGESDICTAAYSGRGEKPGNWSTQRDPIGSRSTVKSASATAAKRRGGTGQRSGTSRTSWSKAVLTSLNHVTWPPWYTRPPVRSSSYLLLAFTATLRPLRPQP